MLSWTRRSETRGASSADLVAVPSCRPSHARGVRARTQGVGFLGISGAVSLIVAAFLPPMATLPFVIYGYGTLLVNVVTTALGPQLDKTIQNRLIDGVDNADDRWVLRQAGRFLGAYLCGVPIESSGIGPQVQH